ncbi:MAG: 30S ribosomal protein S16, partial [Schleiferiaceae bacterium]|nr:30S ribosomal protein S16 [Schleiferiaceae bacterium]MDO7687683.1 30S ribosomal protein S16 [Schleiferiaceae bacterium]MDO7712554.1 30S ribosomal protein S16 [Schleiferiaceae bacterium]
MATRIRLQRHGRKGRPIFTIVIADSRSKRDGRYIQKIGQYNPNTNPASIELDFESALSWLQKGAVPSDTARAILSYEGVMMKKHLLEGVKKGAHTEADVETKFTAWLENKQGKIDKNITGIAANADKLKAERMKAEAEKNAARAAAIATALLVPEVEEATEEVVAEEAAEVVAEETPAAEVVAEEAPAAEVVAEEAAAEVVAEETPAAEVVAEEAPAAEVVA